MFSEINLRREIKQKNQLQNQKKQNNIIRKEYKKAKDEWLNKKCKEIERERARL